MATSVAPVPRWQFFDNSGDPLSGGTLTFYAAGTTTLLDAYYDPDLDPSHAVPNPLTLNAAGRPQVSGSEVNIYFSAANYKIVCADSGGTILWTADYVPADLSATITSLTVATLTATTSITTPSLSISPLSLCEGRLTATSGTPVTTGDVSAATSIYFTPYCGSRIALYDGSARWNVRSFSEITISLSGLTASTPYDLFAYDNAGTVACETLAWTNTTTRATALTTQDGVYVKTGATTRRYLGTVYINASGGQTDDAANKRYVWNYYNRAPRQLQKFDTTDSWTYNGAMRQANNSTANQVEVMVGVAEVLVSLDVVGTAACSSAGGEIEVGIGEDSTSETVSGSLAAPQCVMVANQKQGTRSLVRRMPAIGRRTYAWLEYASNATTTWYGDNGTSNFRNGLLGWVEG